MTTLDSATVAAVANILAKQAKKARKDLAEGEYQVGAHVLVRVDGTVKVSADEEYTPTSSVPLKATMALFMRYAGVTGPHAMEALTRAMSEAIVLDQKGQEAVEGVADIEAAEAVVVAGMEALPKKSRAGKVVVRATLTAQVVESEADSVEKAA